MPIGARSYGTIVAAEGTFYRKPAPSRAADPRRGRMQPLLYDYSEMRCWSASTCSLFVEGRSLSRARCADRRLCRRVCARRTGASIEDGSAGAAAEERRQAGTKAAHGPVFPRIGYIETLEAAKASPHYTAPLGKLQGRGVASGFWFNAGGDPPLRSTSPRTATSSSPPAIPISAVRAPRSPTSALNCSASIIAAFRS